jgi:ABC-type glycerol-3-phosphate transport system permease component
MASERNSLDPKAPEQSGFFISTESVLVSVAALILPFLGVTFSPPPQSSVYPGLLAALTGPDLWHSAWLARLLVASGIEIVLVAGIGLAFSKAASNVSRSLGRIFFLISAISLLCWLAIPSIRSLENGSILADFSISLPIYIAAVLAHLRLVQRSVYDAISIDGASPWLTFKTVIFPLVRPALLIVVLSRLFVSFQEFARHYGLSATIPLGCALTVLAAILIWRAFVAGVFRTSQEKVAGRQPIDTVKLLDDSNINLLEVKLRSKEGTQIQMFGESAWTSLSPELAQQLQQHQVEKVAVGVRPANVQILSEPKKTAFHGVVYSFEPLGKVGLLTIEAVDGTRVRALVEGSLTFAVDRRISFWIDPNDLVLQGQATRPAASNPKDKEPVKDIDG